MAGDLGGTLELDVAEEDRAFFAAARRRQQGETSLAPADAEARGQVGWLSPPPEEAPLGVDSQFLTLLAPDRHAEEALGETPSQPAEVPGAPQPWPALREAELTAEHDI